MAETNNEQSIVDGLILSIRSAVDPDSVTPEMVGRVLSFLNLSGKNLAAKDGELDKTIQDLQSTDKTSETKLKTLQTDLENLTALTGKANGLATLNERGLVNEAQLLSPAIYFSGMFDPSEVERLAVGISADHRPWEEMPGGECCMVYNTRDNCLWLRTPDAQNGGSDGYTYLRTWTDCWREGERKSVILTIPYYHRIYIDVTTARAYYWNGSRLRSLTEAPERAFAGQALELSEHERLIAESSAMIRMLGYELREARRERERLEERLRSLGATCSDEESGLWSGLALWRGDSPWTSPELSGN